MHRLFLLLFLIVSGASLAQAQPGSLLSSPTASTAELVTENRTIAPGGTFTLALKLDHPDDWHSYYQNSGGVEQPPAIKWSLPEGFTAGPIQWPVPEVKDGYFGKSFVYSGSPVFLIDITASTSSTAGSNVEIKADATWQICKESCISEAKSFSLTLPIGTTGEKDPAQAALFEAARKSQPAKVTELKARSHPTGGDITLMVEAEGVFKEAPADFIPDQPFVLAASAGGSIARDGEAWVVTLKRATKDILDNDI
ncbi:MAG: hypothetical protein EOP87_26500, partial [Verrucomicrobiaceae bacterium]